MIHPTIIEGPPMTITRFDDCKKYELDKGVMFREMQTRETGTKVLSVGTATFQPGRYLPCHRHNCEEVIVILSGDALVDMSGQRTAMKPFDSSYVAEAAPHRFVNASKTDELTILWIYPIVNVERLLTDYRECMGAAPSEPGEQGYIPIRPESPADLQTETLVSQITAEVLQALKTMPSEVYR